MISLHVGRSMSVCSYWAESNWYELLSIRKIKCRNDDNDKSSKFVKLSNIDKLIFTAITSWYYLCRIYLYSNL